MIEVRVRITCDKCAGGANGIMAFETSAGLGEGWSPEEALNEAKWRAGMLCWDVSDGQALCPEHADLMMSHTDRPEPTPDPLQPLADFLQLAAQELTRLLRREG